MLEKLLSIYKSKFSSRWLVLVIDMIIVVASFVLTNLIKDEFDIYTLSFSKLLIQTAFVSFVTLICFQLFQTYRGVVRHTSRKDINNLLIAVFTAIVFVFFVSLYAKMSGKLAYLNIKLSVLIFYFLISLFLLVNLRFLFRHLIQRLSDKIIQPTPSNKVLIYGAGEMGIITKSTLDADNLLKYKVVGFIDDDKSKIGLSVDGLKVYSRPWAFDMILKDKSIKTVVLAINNLPPKVKSEIINSFLTVDVDVKLLPNIENWINGKLSLNQLKSVQIEDLLQREPIQLDNSLVKNAINNKIVMVTGAAGSIGSEISRQLMYYAPKQLIFIDQAESPLHDLEYELKETKQNTPYTMVMCDVSNKSRLEQVFQTHHPEIIFHAAAYKHVPMMENNASEAFRVNVLGTKNVADLAVKHQVERFVMVSTDKAVNPTNVMGASKRLAEIYTQSLCNSSKNNNTKFITTRFGNVLGSNGSVIPLFKKQIEKGGPITITHPEINRFFMTIPEACQLVLEAGSTGNGGEIYVFDMGESVKIIDLAKRMIILSGLEYGKDIQIEFTGLRPGEKLYEELLAEKENITGTHNPKIMIAKVFSYEYEKVENGFNELIQAYQAQDEMRLIRSFKSLVPEYISQNSVFEQLDKSKI